MYFSQVCVLISDWNSRNLLSLEYSSSCLVVPYWTLDLAAADPLKSNKTMRTINKSSQKSDLKFNGPRKKINIKLSHINYDLIKKNKSQELAMIKIFNQTITICIWKPPQELLSQLMSGYQLSLPPSTLSKVLCPIFEKFFFFYKN